MAGKEAADASTGKPDGMDKKPPPRIKMDKRTVEIPGGRNLYFYTFADADGTGGK